ncbi:MAG: YbaK/EbsC family protein [Nitriliruptorales bacterium]
MTDNGIEARVLAEIDALGVAYETIRIDPDLADTASFCAHYGYALEDSVNCIVVASRDDPPLLAACLNLATTKLDVNKRVRKLLGVRKLSFASADLTRDATGMLIGGVTPFGLPRDQPGGPDPLRLYVDARVVERPRVIVGGGSRSLKVLVDSAAFHRLDRAEIVEDLAIDA